jgi:hypothetical protein
MIFHLVTPSPAPRLFRFRFSNAFGSSMVRFSRVSVARHVASAHIDAASEKSLTFDGSDTLSLEAGSEIPSDGVSLPWIEAFGADICVTFTLLGTCPDMTWHAKAMTTNYISRAGSGQPPHDAGDEFFEFSCTSWFFLCGADAWSQTACRVVAVLGDSIADGTNSTLNGRDKWPEILGRCMNRQLQQEQQRGPFTYVINCGIGGNSISLPLSRLSAQPHRGGVAACFRMLEEVLPLCGIAHCIWSQGINDFSMSGSAAAAEVVASVTQTLAQAKRRAPCVKFLACTLPSALNASCSGHGHIGQDVERRAFNHWIRSDAAPFDRIIDFDDVLPVCQSILCPARTKRFISPTMQMLTPRAVADLPCNRLPQTRAPIQHHGMRVADP